MEPLLNLYCILFPNTKKYYGIETVGKNRWKRHQASALRGSLYPVHCALRKYGPENCKLIYIYKGISKEYAFKLEMAFIKAYKTQDREFGYNVAGGGEGCWGVKHLRPITEEHKEAIRAQLKTAYANGTRWSPEGKRIIAEKQSLRNKEKYSKMTPEERKAVTEKARKAFMEKGGMTPEVLEKMRIARNKIYALRPKKAPKVIKNIKRSIALKAAWARRKKEKIT